MIGERCSENCLICGDALTVLRTLASNTVQTCVTSPPYFCLRDYGIPEQIGLEETPESYIDKLVEVFREVRRVLRHDGTLWLNLGDSYAGSMKGMGSNGKASGGTKQQTNRGGIGIGKSDWSLCYLKSKDLIGIPWRVALALQADGWYLRSDIIWRKTNAMPSSVKDRPTKDFEYVFLLSRSKQYFYDAAAICEPISQTIRERNKYSRSRDRHKSYSSGIYHSNEGMVSHHGDMRCSSTRNRRSVWDIPVKPYHEAHFAVMPPALVELCILAGSAPRACSHCNAPMLRVSIPTGHRNNREPAHAPFSTATKTDSTGWAPTSVPTDTWEPGCHCANNTGDATCIILDPFSGAGTVPYVASQLGRRYIGIDLNSDYIAMADRRLRDLAI